MSGNSGSDRFCGCKTTTTTMTVGELPRMVCIECGGVIVRTDGGAAGGGYPYDRFPEPNTIDCPECGIGVYPGMGRCLNCGWEMPRGYSIED